MANYKLETPCQAVTTGKSWETRVAVYQEATLFHALKNLITAELLITAEHDSST